MGVVRAVSRRSVDELTQDVGTAGGPGSLDAHVDENLLQPLNTDLGEQRVPERPRPLLSQHPSSSVRNRIPTRPRLGFEAPIASGCLLAVGGAFLPYVDYAR